MTDRAYFPGSAACGQWETLLTEALDGLLRSEDEAVFAAHMDHCKACATLYEEARKGLEWLDFVAAEPEVPAGLLEKILAETGPGRATGPRLAGVAGVLLPAQPAWQRPGFMGFVRRFAEPRLMMTAAMAFFSIALTLNLTGVKLANLKASELRPAAIRSYMERRLTMASTPIVRYYDHLRLAYEVESRMRELRRSTGTSEEPENQQKNLNQGAPGESKQAPGHKDGGSRVEQRIEGPQESNFPVMFDVEDVLESSLTYPATEPTPKPVTATNGHAQSGGSATEQREGSMQWIA